MPWSRVTWEEERGWCAQSAETSFKRGLKGETEEKNLNPVDKGGEDDLRAEGASRYEGPEVPALGTVNGHQAGIIGP